MLKARMDTVYNCGCGFKCKVWKDAQHHIEQTGHTMTMIGVARLMEVFNAKSNGSKNESSQVVENT
jgi:hypothetical protein